MNFHIWFYRLTDGMMGGKMAGRTMLLLTTHGRKSGLARVTPLQYNMDGINFVLIASNGGSAYHPQWFLNLQTHPEATIQVGPKQIAVLAREAQGEERERIWSHISAHFSEFPRYQQHTSRTIPVVLLAPVDA